jgi:hypothetical protein
MSISIEPENIQNTVMLQLFFGIVDKVLRKTQNSPLYDWVFVQVIL